MEPRRRQGNQNAGITQGNCVHARFQFGRQEAALGQLLTPVNPNGFGSLSMDNMAPLIPPYNAVADTFPLGQDSQGNNLGDFNPVNPFDTFLTQATQTPFALYDNLLPAGDFGPGLLIYQSAGINRHLFTGGYHPIAKAQSGDQVFILNSGVSDALNPDASVATLAIFDDVQSMVDASSDAEGPDQLLDLGAPISTQLRELPITSDANFVLLYDDNTNSFIRVERDGNSWDASAVTTLDFGGNVTAMVMGENDDVVYVSTDNGDIYSVAFTQDPPVIADVYSDLSSNGAITSMERNGDTLVISQGLGADLSVTTLTLALS